MNLTWVVDHCGDSRVDLDLYSGDLRVGFFYDYSRIGLQWNWMSRGGEYDLSHLTLEEAQAAVIAMYLLEG